MIKEIKEDLIFIKKHTLQPKWWKITKIFLLLGIVISIFLIFGLFKTIIWVIIFIILSFIVHMLYKVKTQNYKKSWMDFKVRKIKGKLIYKPIGGFYYFLILLIFFISTIIIILI